MSSFFSFKIEFFQGRFNIHRIALFTELCIRSVIIHFEHQRLFLLLMVLRPMLLVLHTGLMRNSSLLNYLYITFFSSVRTFFCFFIIKLMFHLDFFSNRFSIAFPHCNHHILIMFHIHSCFCYLFSLSFVVFTNFILENFYLSKT